jgi:hypothetical protein
MLNIIPNDFGGGSMPDNVERSESGSPIYNHRIESADVSPSQTDSDAIGHFEAHLEKSIGAKSIVFHEIVSAYVHIDVHFFPPTADHNYNTLVTTGMSDRPMPVPNAADADRYAELMLCLPRSWPINQDAFSNEANYWPVRWLKTLARLPSQYNTWLGYGHSVPNGDPPEPYAKNTQLSGAILSTPMLFGDKFAKVVINPDKTINIFSVIPLYREEMAFKLKVGASDLFDLLDKLNVTELLDIKRRNSCQKNSRLKLW